MTIYWNETKYCSISQFLVLSHKKNVVKLAPWQFLSSIRRFLKLSGIRPFLIIEQDHMNMFWYFLAYWLFSRITLRHNIITVCVLWNKYLRPNIKARLKHFLSYGQIWTWQNYINKRITKMQKKWSLELRSYVFHKSINFKWVQFIFHPHSFSLVDDHL